MFIVKRQIVVFSDVIHQLRAEVIIRIFWIAVVFGVFKFMKIPPIKRDAQHVRHERAV